ncbi:bifunctional ligase/repressor BirA [Paenibacillus montaniterrae]|uniref:Bifunctional ligase/repressor BirA n=1 Tax=Paenibacillus montaniterrae TaxID=429341 RepID=A0A919YKT9_9BACL|nr:biotin--[acetyl-CoA-carboxylase] ligase [Paenibacillus montaniterrae]GIP15102.1 bifunctional ligase/repressor BirA [Paenibacillus montaniterrae]
MNNNERLIQLLTASDQFISGEKISEELGISRTAVWKQIKKLEAQGYEIEAITKQGYRLLYAPSPFQADKVEQVLAGHRFGHTIHYYDAVSSTQTIARELAEQGGKEGIVVLAEQQLQGKGRMGRNWHSPYAKGVWMSIILRPATPIQLAPQLTLLAAVALTRAIRTVTALEVGIKWPNDILHQGKKLSGILLESAAEEQQLRYVIAGLGIDVNLGEKDYDQELLQKATSLRIESGKPQQREKLVEAIMLELEALFNLYDQKGFQPIAELWESYALSLGKRISLTTPQEQFEAVPLRLTAAGSIVVRMDDGSEREIYSAEMGEIKQ